MTISQQPFADLEAQAKTNKATTTQQGMPLEFLLQHTVLYRNISKWIGIKRYAGEHKKIIYINYLCFT